MDLAFLIDSSGSIKKSNPEDESYDNWSLLKAFVKKVINSMNVGEDTNHIGLATYSDEAKVIFNLQEYFFKPDIFWAIDNMPYLGENTNTAAGLRSIREEIFGKKGDRPDAQNVLILITDGYSNRDMNETKTQAEQLATIGIEVRQSTIEKF